MWKGWMMFDLATEARHAADFLDSYTDESDLGSEHPMLVSLMRIYAARVRQALAEAAEPNVHKKEQQMTDCAHDNCVTIRVNLNEPLITDVVGAHCHPSEGESVDAVLELALQDLKAQIELRRGFASEGHEVRRGGVVG